MDNNDSVKITILYDNNCLAGFKASWGFSCLIETNENTIIFDTGWDGNVLLHNLELSQVNIEKIYLTGGIANLPGITLGPHWWIDSHITFNYKSKSCSFKIIF